MSTKWGYYCLNDGDISYPWLNHGRETLRRIAWARNEIAALRSTLAFGEGDIELRPDPSLGGSYDGEGPFEWLWVHGSHQIVLRSEWGDVEEVGRPEDHGAYNLGFFYAVTFTKEQREVIRRLVKIETLPDSYQLRQIFEPYFKEHAAQALITWLRNTSWPAGADPDEERGRE